MMRPICVDRTSALRSEGLNSILKDSLCPEVDDLAEIDTMNKAPISASDVDVVAFENWPASPYTLRNQLTRA